MIRKKDVKKLIVVLAAALAIYSIIPFETEAQTRPPESTKYQLLEPLPFVGLADDSTKTDTATYLPGLFRLTIGIATVLAVLVLIYGGFKYLSTDAFGGKNEAKGIIENALWGLLLAMSAWLILNTISPNLVNFNLDIPSQPLSTIGGGTPVVPGRAMTPEEIADDERVRAELEEGRVDINNDPCKTNISQRTGCTNLNGLPPIAVNGLISLKSECECTIVVSGGTEPGPHASHGPNQPVVDIRPTEDLKRWLIENEHMNPEGNGADVPISTSGTRLVFKYERTGEGRSTAPHWHVVIR